MIRRRGANRIDRCPNCGSWQYMSVCKTCLIATRREMEPRMTYDDTRPTRAEAERDEHETAQARGQCSSANPCPACKRMYTR